MQTSDITLLIRQVLSKIDAIVVTDSVKETKQILLLRNVSKGGYVKRQRTSRLQNVANIL